MAQVIAFGADHGGFALKISLVPWLQSQGYEVLDLGAHTLDPLDDYPDFAAAVAQAVAEGKAERGIVICGSGVGACVVANKIPGIRASVCHDLYSARQGVEHDELNVLSLGARVVGLELAQQLTTEFLVARFTGEERHVRRLAKVNAIEQQSRQWQ
ncbi:MAG TPA: ribose 5-phosphate isomerase B [Dehalococcoidia bacterium]|jgi:ribose 5-phosphate isomerase B|nr:ribose 5-phosphate isomerase B [Dehalococcoidia bacterium]